MNEDQGVIELLSSNWRLIVPQTWECWQHQTCSLVSVESQASSGREHGAGRRFTGTGVVCVGAAVGRPMCFYCENTNTTLALKVLQSFWKLTPPENNSKILAPPGLEI